MENKMELAFLVMFHFSAYDKLMKIIDFQCKCGKEVLISLSKCSVHNLHFVQTVQFSE